MSRDPWAPDHVLRDPLFWNGFGSFVNEYVAAQRRREEEIEQLSGGYYRKYGVKQCPFHSLSPTPHVEMSNHGFRYQDQKYPLLKVECGEWSSCSARVSFDRDLIARIEETQTLKEVKSHTSEACPSCGGRKGTVYDTGLSVSYPCSRGHATPMWLRQTISLRRSPSTLCGFLTASW
jgi:hypothetical protein